MLPTIGYFLLWFSLFFAIFQYMISFRENLLKIIKFNKIASGGILLSVLLSFTILIYSHIISDFSVLNVFENSHTTKPLIYKITGVWGNHEGSMLLWTFVLALVNYFIAKTYNDSNSILITKTLQTQALIIIGFIIFIIYTSNPFERLTFNPANGLGFNPILQDLALAIHPPLLYIGYVGFSAAFAFSVAAMSINSKSEIKWYKYMKPFVVVSWTFLTVGIAFGSVWAYYELGWGGWWFWDPVENAAFMPWLIGTALLHSLISVEKRKSLQTWVLLLAILSFLLSITGTFLVRSGILTSVHTFALDPTRGIYILAFISILGVYSLALFSIKSKNFISNYNFYFISREGAILVNNLMICVVCASVFFGTMYPLFVEVFSKNRISVGEPYFNLTIVPLFIPALFIMGVGPILSWGKNDTRKIFFQIFPSIIGTIITLLIIILFFKYRNIFGIVGIGLFFWIIFNIISTIFLYFSSKLNISKSFFPKQSLSMIISHLGVGLMILGITGSSIWQKEKISRMHIDDKITINNYNIIFKDIKTIEGPNYVSLQANFLLSNHKNKTIASLKPENRYYHVTKSTTTEASIHTNLLRDVYIVIGEGNMDQGWIVRIYYNPLVVWIWIGVFVIFVGGCFAFNNNIKKLKSAK